jgi:hypothetical protein
MSTSNEQIADLDPRSAALAAAVLEVARFLGEDPQDHVRWFALLGSAELLAQQPSLAALLGPEAAATMAADDLHLTSIELEDAPELADPLDALAQLSWPADAQGLAAAFVLPAGSWTPATRGADGAPGSDRDHTTDQDLRAVVAVTSDGTRFSAVARPGQPALAVGANLIPALADALASALEPQG